jgi:dual oxidase
MQGDCRLRTLKGLSLLFIIQFNVHFVLQVEFAEALAVKPDSLFAEQMFAIIDHDGNGYISFRELLNTVLLFAQGAVPYNGFKYRLSELVYLSLGTFEDKLQMMFSIYDVDRNGSLSRAGVASMIK